MSTLLFLASTLHSGKYQFILEWNISTIVLLYWRFQKLIGVLNLSGSWIVGFKMEILRIFMEESWKKMSIQGWGTFILIEKLKGLKSSLKVWNANKFGNIHKMHQGIVIDGIWEDDPLKVKHEVKSFILKKV